MKTIHVLLMSGLFAVSAVTSVQAAGDIAKGESTFTAKGCIGCHGPAGDSQAPEMFPKLKGRDEAYILTQLTDFKSGKRVSTTMNPMASTLTEEDINNIAAYISSNK